MAATVTEDILDLRALEEWSLGFSANEPVEVFKCQGCSAVFIGLPDSHLGYIDPKDPSINFTYNVPRKVACPNCKAIWYGGVGAKAGYALDPVTQSELEASPWQWLLQR